MAQRTPITLILFDAFDTLVVPRKPPHIQYAEEVRNVGVHISDHDMKDAFKKSFKKMAKEHPIYGLDTGLASPNEWWTMLIQGCLVNAGVSNDKIAAIMPELGPSLLHRFSTEKGYRHAEGVTQIFTQLIKLRKSQSRRSGETSPSAHSLRWNLATNSDARILLALKSLGFDQHLKLTVKGQSGLDDYKTPRGASVEDGAAASADDPTSEPCLSYFLGSEKPHESFFHKAVQRSFPSDTTTTLTELCAQTLYVGDGLAEDYIGARKAGLQAVWLQRQQAWPVDMKEAERAEVHAVKSMSDVIDIVKESWS